MKYTNLNKNHTDGNLSLEDLRKWYKEMEKEQILSSYTFPAKPSSDGFFHVYVSAAGGRKQIKAKNLDKLKEKVYEYEKGVNGITRKTFRDVFEVVQSEKTRYIKDPEKLISINNSINVRRSYYKRFFSGTEFENMFIDVITKNDIEEFCYDLLSRLNLKKKAFMDMRNILSSTFKLAYGQYWILDNPYTRVDFRKYNDLFVRDTSLHKRVHSSNEIDRMLDWLHEKQKEKPEYIPSYALELQILMGLRRGEIAPLEWDDIYDNVIHISKEQISVKGSYDFVIVGHTKTYTDRIFPITSAITGFLDRLKSIHDEFYPKSPYLFPDDTQKNKVINNHVVYRLYVRMCKKLGIVISREITRGPHSFRRNGITNVCNATGGNMYLASVLYGNSPQSASKHYYTGINITEAREILEGNPRREHPTSAKLGNQKVTKGNQLLG